MSSLYLFKLELHCREPTMWLSHTRIDDSNQLEKPTDPVGGIDVSPRNDKYFCFPPLWTVEDSDRNSRFDSLLAQMPHFGFPSVWFVVYIIICIFCCTCCYRGPREDWLCQMSHHL